MWHLDSNIIVAILRGNRDLERTVRSRIKQIGVSALVMAELRYGARKSLRPDENLLAIERVTRFAQVAPFDADCADIYSRVRVNLQRIGRPSGDVDLLIANVAIAHNAIFVTNNKKHFEAIDGLVIEDWLSP